METIANMEGTELLTTRQAASFLNRKVQTLRRWRVRSVGPPFIRPGTCSPFGRCMYRRSDIEAWLASRTFRSTAEETAARDAAERG